MPQKHNFTIIEHHLAQTLYSISLVIFEIGFKSPLLSEIILTHQCMYSVVKCTGHHPGVVYPLFKPYFTVMYIIFYADDDESVRLVLSVSTLCSTLMKGHYSTFLLILKIILTNARNIHTVKRG